MVKLEVPLPIREGVNIEVNSKGLAQSRARSLRKRLLKDPPLLKQYNEVIR